VTNCFNSPLGRKEEVLVGVTGDVSDAAPVVVMADSVDTFRAGEAAAESSTPVEPLREICLSKLLGMKEGLLVGSAAAGAETSTGLSIVDTSTVSVDALRA
jgi:hypothetical protein